MATAATPTDAWSIALAKAFNNGVHMKQHFKMPSIRSAADLIAFKPSFRHAPTVLEIEELQAALAALNATITTVKWPDDSTKGCRLLRRLLYECESAAGAETRATYATLPGSAAPAGASPGAPKAPEKDPTALAAIGARSFEVAAKIYPAATLDLSASNRVKYELVGKLATAFAEGVPVTYALQEYVLQLTVTKPKDVTYEAFGQKWVSQEAHGKLAAINTIDDLERAMERRRQAVVTAGSFDIDQAKRCASARARGSRLRPRAVAPCAQRVVNHKRGDSSHVRARARSDKGLAPAYQGDLRAPTNKVQYIDGNLVKTITVFASAEGTAAELKAMKAFRRRAPHASAATLVDKIDSKVQEAIWNMLLLGYTYDAAVQYAPARACPNAMRPARDALFTHRGACTPSAQDSVREVA